MVGERGPEGGHLPRGSAMTPNKAEPNRMMGGNTISVTVNGARDQIARQPGQFAGSYANSD